MFWAFIFIWTMALAAGIGAVWALSWAISRGQFRNLRKAALTIFDDEEPAGRQTDFFPEVHR
jgi:nitrogen fixation-related uncharacterized protein